MRINSGLLIGLELRIEARNINRDNIERRIVVDGVADLFCRLLGPGIELWDSDSSYHGHAKESRNVGLCLFKSH
jgi:hypothetical protein